MCKAIQDWIAEEREEGRIEGKIEGAISICRDLEIPDNIIFQKIKDRFNLSEETARKYMHTPI